MTKRDEIRETVRVRAQFACEYCGVRETDSGDLLTIDHFQPVGKGGDDSLENLVYCCELIDGNGLWIGPEHNSGGIGAGPGMSESRDILFVIGITNGEPYTKEVPGRRGYWRQWERNADLDNAKLVCRMDEDELIFSLPLLEDLQVQ